MEHTINPCTEINIEHKTPGGISYKVGDIFALVGTNDHMIWNISKITDEYIYNSFIKEDGELLGNYQTSKLIFEKNLDNNMWYIVRDKNITIKDTLNNMDQKIEIGDTFRFTNVSYIAQSFEENYEGKKIIRYYNHITDTKNDWGFYNVAVLVSKANKGEIVGYELLKDLPGIPAGTQTVKGTLNSHGAVITNNTLSMGLIPTQLQDTTWFKPIYKAKQIVVNISGNRQVGIKDKEIKMIGDALLFKEAISFDNLSEVYSYITNMKMFNTKIKIYPLEILTFKLGCVELTKEDITSIYEAIQPILQTSLD